MLGVEQQMTPGLSALSESLTLSRPFFSEHIFVICYNSIILTMWSLAVIVKYWKQLKHDRQAFKGFKIKNAAADGKSESGIFLL